MKKRPTAKPRRMVPKLVESQAADTNNPDFSTVRRRINDLVAREAVEMVGGAVDAAKDGQHSAMKCLFELVGLFPPPVESVEDPGEGLVEKLLRQLDIEESPDLEPIRRKNPKDTGQAKLPLR